MPSVGARKSLTNNSEKQDPKKSCIFSKEEVQETRLKIHRRPGKFTASRTRQLDFFLAQIFTSGMDLPEARDIDSLIFLQSFNVRFRRK